MEINRKPRAVPIPLLCSRVLVLGGYNKKDKNKVGSDKSSEEAEAISEGEYSTLLPFSVSDAEQKHVQVQTNLSDILTIGTGLMEFSKEYFSSRIYAFRGGKHLDYNTLGASADDSGLLERMGKKNVNGLNPAVGDIFPADGGNKKITTNDVLLLNILECDWCQDEELKGLSLALVLNDKIDTEPKEATIDSDKMKLYGKECTCRLVSYLRKAKPETRDSTPIYVALYSTSSDDATLPGTYFEEAYSGSRTNAEFKAINEKWALFPASTVIKLDRTDATYFDRYEASFQDFLGQNIDMISKGHFMDNELTDLCINVKLHAKSVNEVIAVVQLLDERLPIFSSNNFKITIVVKADGVDVATITRNKGTSSMIAQTLLC